MWENRSDLLSHIERRKMSQSNYRSRQTNTVHHLGSRIAHKVYFLEDDERNDFLEMARRVADFVGIKLIGWCIMTNHFHLLIYLPDVEDVGEQEVLRRYSVLKGQKAGAHMGAEIARWRQAGPSGESMVREWLDSQRRRMYSVAEYMKILKQWFTTEYNRRHAHRGTLWEATYFDRIVKYSQSEIAKRLAYIHLNPIRAAMATSFDGYVWSSYRAFVLGDELAVSGMRFVYGDDLSKAEISARHEELMQALLEEEKQQRAMEIAQKFAEGCEMPRDPITTEAEIAQAAARMKQLEREMSAIRVQRELAISAKERFAKLCDETLCVMKMHPEFNVGQVMEAMSLSRSAMYRVLDNLKERHLVEYRERGVYRVGQKVLSNRNMVDYATVQPD